MKYLILASSGIALTSQASAQNSPYLADKKKSLSQNLTEFSASKSELKELEANTAKASADKFCYLAYNTYAKQVLEIIELANDSARGGLAAQIDKLTAEQIAYASAIEATVKDVQALPIDTGSIGDSVQKLRATLASDTAVEAKLMGIEQTTLTAISRSVGHLNAVRGLFSKLNNCSENSEEISDLDSLAETWATKLGGLYNSVADTFAKRIMLRDALRSNLESWLLKQSSKSTLVSLNDLTTRIEGAFKADRFLYKVALWWGEAYIGRGPGRGSERFYHMYAGTIRNMRADVARADQLVEEAKSLKFEPSVEAKVLKTVNGYRQFLSDDIERIRTQGWKKQYDTQLAFLDSYERRFNSPICRLQILKQRGNLENTASQEEFAVREIGFAAVYDSCIK